MVTAFGLAQMLETVPFYNESNISKCAIERVVGVARL